MSALLNFLNGNVPGGISVPIVVIIAFLLVLEFIYRAGEYMPSTVYRRLRLLGPVFVLVIYTLFWLQAPPKPEPLRLAVVGEGSDRFENWRSGAIADLTGRRLARSLDYAVVNPWEGAVEEYPATVPDVLVNSGYEVFLVKWEAGQEGGIPQVHLRKANGSGSAFPIARENLSIISKEIARWILAESGESASIAAPFSREFSQDVLTAHYQAKYYQQDDEPASAETLYHAALQIDSTFTQARIGLGQSYEALGDRSAAEQELLLAFQSDTASFEALLALGEFYLRGFVWEKAEPALKAVLRGDPLRVRTYPALTRIHPERLKDLEYDTVPKLLGEAVRLDPAFELTRIVLAGSLMKTGKVTRARQLLQDGLTINPASIDLLLKAGTVELYSGESKAAVEYYQRIFKYDPQNPLAAFNLGVVYYRMDDLDNAVKHFSNSLGWDGPVDGFYYMGMIYQKKGDRSRAKFYYNKRWKMRSGDDDVYGIKAKQMADALEQMNGRG
jgi:tetratricopeptide (TPR) repeat protein